MNKLLSIVITIILLSGCSIASPIQKASLSESRFDKALLYHGRTTVVDDKVPDDAYRIFHQAATGFVSIASIRSDVEQRATEFCEKKNKAMHVLKERTASPPYILGNFPRVEIVFSCIEPTESSASTGNQDKYEQLKKFKTLLDDGTLTEKEFIAEKSKLLSE
ncbi:MAG: SHOCT domain-containing protein [Syntrophales bacterium]